MVYYSFFNFFKILKFALKGSFKVLKYLLLIPLLVFTIFLIISNSNSVSAAGFPTTLSQQDIDDLLILIDNLDPNHEYSNFLYCKDVRLILFNGYNTNTSMFYLGTGVGGTTRVYSNFAPSGKMYTQVNLSNHTANYWGGIESNTNMLYYDVSDSANLYASVPVYQANQTTLLFDPVTFVAPYLYPNALQDQTALTSGSFTFFIVNPGSVPVTDSIQLDFADFSDDYNGENPVQEITLNRNSPFFQYTNIDQTEYQYVITARFLPWFKLINGKKYRAILGYYNNSGQDLYITYDWIMSISSEQQQIIEDTTQQDINSGIYELNNSINQTNDFLSNSSYDPNSIIDNMPDFNHELVDLPYDSFLTTLFDSLKNAFISNEPIDFEFVLPFSNGQKIIFPSDYIEQHCPQVIITLVRLFYWYIISRYILKDVWHTIDKMRQGVWFSGASEDIKTEVL